ncbi:hypothetical protein Tco_1322638 [Tanacetum coccineum]
MSTLKFAKTHNIVVYLAKPTESEGFEQIIDFLNASSIRYALTVNPTVYVSCINQFWTTDEVKKVNGEAEIHAIIDGKRIVVSEAKIRSVLQFGDEGGVECLPTTTIFEEISKMGYEKPSQKLTFYKAFFNPKWKFMIHTIMQCLSAKTTAWNEFSSIVASTIICLATNQKFNFSKFILEGMLKNLDAKAVKFLMYLRFVQLYVNQVEELSSHHRKYVIPCHTKKFFGNIKRVNKDFSSNVTPLFPTTVVQTKTPPPTITPTPIITSTPITTSTPTPTQPTTSVHPSQPQKQRVRKPTRRDTKVTQPSEPEMVVDEDVLELEKTKSSHQIRIESLERKVKKLEKGKKTRTHKLKRLYKVSLSARVISLEDEAIVGDQDDASKQGRKIADIDENEDITLVDEVEGKKDNMMVDVDELTGKEIVVEAEVAKDVNLNEDEVTLAQTLQKIKSTTPKEKWVVVREQDAEKDKLFVQLLEARKKHFAVKRVEELRSKPPTKAQKRKTMSTYLKNMAG